MREECRLVEDALKRRKPLLGICLGSQLIASALGARVESAEHAEVGWYRVYLSDEGRADPLFGTLPVHFVAFHWHKDIFENPPGAKRLAYSDRTSNQAFLYERAFGILFHLEVTEETVKRMTERFPEELERAQVSAEELLTSKRRFRRLETLATRFYRKWVETLSV